MRRLATWVIGFGGVVGVAVVLGAGVAVAQQDDVSASKGWVKLPAAGETTAAAFAVVNNPTMYDVYLVSATTDVAEKVEFRQTADQSVKALTVPAYGAVAMGTDGVHLLLTGLKRPLEENERISLTLKTSDGITMTVSAVVRKE